MTKPEYLLVCTAIYELEEVINEVWCFEVTLIAEIKLHQVYLNVYPFTIPKLYVYRPKMLQNPETTYRIVASTNTCFYSENEIFYSLE